MAGQGPNMEQFEAYFMRADVDRDGRISGHEAVTFLQASNLPRQVLAQIWMYADQNRAGFLGRSEFYNALKLVTVAQSKRELTPELVKAALYGPASAKIPAPQISIAATQNPQSNANAGPSPAQLGGPPNSTQGVAVSGMHGFPAAQPSQVTRPPRPPPPNSGFQSQPGVLTQGMPGTGSTSVSQRPNSLDLLPASSKPNDTALLSSQVGKEDSKSLSATGNGFASDSLFGDTFSARPSQPQQNSPALNVPTSSTGILNSSRDQPSVKPSAVSQPPAVQAPQVQPSGKANQHVLAQRPPAYPVASGQSQPPWPRMTQSDVQKYSKVFVQVDTDRDGKITGEQARNLFLSWRLPREVLKQVWDLSDQDNDSMLTLREFCIALYLMERYREGRPLPSTLPNSVMFEETLVPASGQPAAAYGNTSWRPPTPGFQPQGTRNARSIPSVGGKPPRPAPIPQPDEPIQQKAKVPVLEKHLLDQLSTEEQNSLNKKFEEAKDAEKKVSDLEKEIAEAKQKIQFYHAKMQELILYKSRCDNRLNEISERVVGDKREAESLAKKYEEKYKQSGDVASKLTIEEATFRDIQEKKMELYRAIVKLEQENADGIQERADQIQADLDELVKSLNERCKTYGLRGKPTSLVELPFGWQIGIEAAAADWDEVWDKFEDEGFTYVKELTLEVENVVAPPKPKSALIREKVTSSDTVKSPSKADDSPNTHNPEQAARTPPDSPAGSNTVMSPSKGFQDQMAKDINVNGSPHAFDTQSEFGAESVLGDKGFDEPGWGTFDSHYDSDAAWDFNKEADREGSLFGGDDWGLQPIKTSVAKKGPFFDSVPSTPLYNSTPHADSLFKSSPFPFADSVPSTPMYNNEGGSEEQYSFDNNSLSRFDSFNMHDSGPFGSRDNNTFSRFDSMRSTRDSSDFDQGGALGSRESFTRFDSFRSTADSDYNFGRETLTRFDSMRSTNNDSFDYGHGFPSFDDAADPFKRTSFDAQTPRRDFDGPFGTSFDAQTPRSNFDGPFGTSFDAQTPRRDSDGPFKISFDAQTPRKEFDGPFRPSFDSQTPRKDSSDSWKAF